MMLRELGLSHQTRFLALALWAGTLGVAGCASPIVGAECISGFSVCDGRCVDLQSDRLNCGSCGNRCDFGLLCVSGVCSDTFDAGANDGGMSADRDITLEDGGNPDDDGGAEAGTSDGGETDGGDGAVGDSGPMDAGFDAGPPDPCSLCDIGQLCCNDICVRPDTAPAHCGMCNNPCADDQVCAAGSCEDICEAPLSLCGEFCVNHQTDPDYCGNCFTTCSSGVCVDGACAAETAGHVVLIGHDYRIRRVGQNRFAGNSVFIPAGSNVDVLTFEGEAIGAAVVGVNQAINQVAGERGRTWTQTAVATPAEVPLELGSVDVFVVYAQSGATNEELRMWGTDWATSLGSFLRRGGVVVVFDGGGSNDGTYQILDAAGLLAVSSRTSINNATVDVSAPADVVANGAPLTYRAEVESVRFDTVDGTTVVSDGTGPVIVHSVVLP